MAKRLVAALALVIVVALPTPAPKALDHGISNHRPFGELGNLLPQLRQLLRRNTPRLPRYYYDNRSGRFLPRRPMVRSDVVAALQRQGFRDIAIIQQRGTTYICEATGQGGERVRLIVNGLTGGIDGVRLLSPRLRRF